MLLLEHALTVASIQLYIYFSLKYPMYQQFIYNRVSNIFLLHLYDLLDHHPTLDAMLLPLLKTLMLAKCASAIRDCANTCNKYTYFLPK